MTDRDSHRRSIALAEHNVERQRADLRQRTTATRERLSGWKAPLILGGGALLGLLLGRSRGKAPQPIYSMRQNPSDAVPYSEPSGAARVAGKAAGFMAALSLASRALPLVLSVARAYAQQRQRT